MDGPIGVLLVGEDPQRRHTDAASLAGSDAVTVVGDVPPGWLESGTLDGDVDCVLTGAPDPLDGVEVPVVAHVEAPPSAAADCEGYVRRPGDTERLVDELCHAAARGPAPVVDQGALLDRLADGVLVVDADDEVRYCNAAVAAALDVGRRAIRGRSLRELLVERISTDERTVAALEAAVADVRAGRTDRRPLELSLTLPDGTDRALEFRLSRLGADGVEGVVAAVRDVTRRRAVERDLRDRRETIADLHAAASDFVGAADESELCERAVAAAETVLEFDVCSIVMRDGEWLVPQAASSGTPADGTKRYRIGEGLSGKTYATGESYLVDDVADLEAADPADPTYRSCVSVPVGEYGVFQAAATEPGRFDEDDLELAELLISHVTAVLGRLRVEDRLRERQRTIERLHEVTADIVACRSEREVCQRTVEAAASILDLEVCVVALAEEGDLVLGATSGGEHAPSTGTRLDPETGIVGKTFRTGESILVEDLEAADDAVPYDETYSSALSVPIGGVGVLQAISREVGTYDETDQRLAELLVSHVAETIGRIRIEERLRDREAALVTERDRFAALFENVPDPVAAFEFVEGEPIVRALNGPFQETFGWDARELRGENIDEYIVPEGREDDADRLNETLRSGERLRTTVRRRTAEDVRDFLLQVVPLSVGERSTHGYAIYSDVSDQKRRERELERQNERLDRFASIVSHDLRNPLSVAEGHLELARETGDDGFLERVADAHDRMYEMIDDLLRLARHGDLVGETEPVALDAVARRAWDGVETADATLSVSDDRSLTADPDRLRELLANLYRNAIEHGGPGVTVEVGSCRGGFYVADDGPGIPEPDRESVFESGYSTAEDGTGLGLTIVEDIAQAHDWSVAVGEGPDGGARFEFRLAEAPPPAA